MTSAPVKTALVLALAAATAACHTVGASQAGAASDHAIVGESKTLEVSGQYAPLVLDEVDHLAREDGKVLVYGSSKGVPVHVPDDTDVSQPNLAWRLVTESNLGETRRVTFTHDMSLEDFSIELPKSDDELHYGAFLSKQGGSILIFAWGSHFQSYWGYVTIRKKPS
jgi:hypothetical protein